jgi:solute carrier family 13 (sodium-dependent dicarboxylate transporter), member 2/3/5
MSGLFESHPDPPPPKLLVADDEGHFRGAMKKKLMARKYHVIDVKTGKEAIRAAASQLPEVVIIDHHLPDISGLQAAREIKKKHPDIRVILLAGYGNTDQPSGLRDKVVFKNLYKPCGIAELIDTIESARRERAEEITREDGRRGIFQQIFGWFIDHIMKIRNLHI